MHALRILAILGVFLALTVVYLFWDNEEDLQTLSRACAPEAELTETALAESASILRELEKRKSAQRKKIELADYRSRFSDLEARRASILEDDDRDRLDRRRELEELAKTEYFELRRDAEDLAARLREMKSYDDELRPEVAAIGQLRRQLNQATGESTDLLFQQRAQELLSETRNFLKLAEDAMTQTAFSITRGRPLGQAALKELRKLRADMELLLAGGDPGERPERPSAEEVLPGQGFESETSEGGP